jgi:putative salt-induced outer membrane protein YdiY
MGVKTLQNLMAKRWARRRQLLMMTLLTIPLFSTAVGDEIMMINGDRLSGRILQIDAKTIVIKPLYAAAIALNRDQVHSLHYEQAPTATHDPKKITTPIITSAETNRQQQDTTVSHPMDQSTVSAQIAPTPPLTLTSTQQLNGRINFALSMEQGNSKQNEIDIDYDIKYHHGWHRIESIGAFEFDTDDGEKTIDKWSTHNRYSRHFPSGWYGAGWLALKHDRFANLRLRTLGGPALGYLAFENPAHNLSIEAGPMMLRDDFYQQPDQTFWGSGWFLNYDQLIWHQRLQPYHRQFGYVALDGAHKFIWQAWTGLRIPMGDSGLTSSLEFEYDYDSSPAIKAKTTDTTLRFKLGYQW